MAGVFRRRAATEDGFEPVSGEPPDMFLEAWQGAQRPAILGRVELIGQMYPVLMSVARLDPLAGAFASHGPSLPLPMPRASGRGWSTRWFRPLRLRSVCLRIHRGIGTDRSAWRVHRWSSGEVAGSAGDP